MTADHRAPRDPQFAQWLLSFAAIYKREPTPAEIAAYKLSHPDTRHAPACEGAADVESHPLPFDRLH